MHQGWTVDASDYGTDERVPLPTAAPGPVGRRAVRRRWFNSAAGGAAFSRLHRVKSRVSFLLAGNKRSTRVVTHDVNWIFWLIIVWLGLSAFVAFVFGRVIRIREEHESPLPLHDVESAKTYDPTSRTVRAQGREGSHCRATPMAGPSEQIDEIRQ
ncbi:hypothetical protein ACLBYD_27445 [Rhodococcus sp. C26F]